MESKSQNLVLNRLQVSVDVKANSQVRLPKVWSQMTEGFELFFHVVLFNVLYKVVLTFKSVDETLVCDHSNESYWAVLSSGAVYCVVQDGSNF